MWATRKPSSLVTLALAASIAAIFILSGPAESVPVSLDSGSYIDHYPRADPDAPPSKPNPAQKPKKEDYEFEFLNPEPNDTWTSGEIVSLSWVDTDLPWRTTFDFTLVPADPDTNPEALEITRRPFLRYVSAMERTLDIVVPYDLITKQQLMLEQEQDGTLIEHNEGDPHDEYQPDVTTELLGLNVTRVTIAKTTTHTDIQSLARLYITAYEGKTNNMLLRKSIFPIVILKDHKKDWRALLPPVVTDNITSENEDVESDDYVEDMLEGNNSEIAYDDDDDGDETNGESDDADSQIDNQVENASEENSDETTNETEDSFMDMDHMDQEHEHSDHEHESEDDDGEEMEHHGHSHVMDPNHFQNDEDVELWEEHEEEPGYNPPIKVIDAGTIQVTNWIHNRVRFFVGSPYVFSWEFPESGLGLTGEVNVYVEDAYTGQRYDIAAANLPSSVQFMYLHPTAMMMSTNPKKKIYLRARVELDLFKDGNIHRYTAFSKMFFVVRGAL
ncbi:hypothetical protein BGZ80_002823 [Entomortierella chlamydospora]|uniref:Uncharacterized protein n=1 Tax=Entomortierella chlamydospora TaxID=101097 RepID=A0A9P6MPZ0_9FUNG|nr:hypothetical protein BGZ79_002187 [Entomortierella chlamydospora]KAG0009018.1 hypothetical protein BGZ80_002823 [Entomortierella chlamydospora]